MSPTSDAKAVVEKYMEGFRRSDHAMVLSCLTDDVEWHLPGPVRLKGKVAFDKEIENPAFVGRPTITVSGLFEEGNVVVAEGRVQCEMREGGTLDIGFCDVFVFRNGLICKLTSYLSNV